MVALDEDVRDVEGADLARHGVLGGTAVVRQVAAVEDDIDVELADKRMHDVPRRRVVMEIRDAQHAQGARIRLVGGQRRDHAVQA